MAKDRRGWWDAKADERGNAVKSAFFAVRQSLYNQRWWIQGYQKMYGSVDRQGNHIQGPQWFTDGKRARYNIASMFVDTAASRIATMRPKIRFQLEDGEWDTYRKARQVDRVISGQWEKLNLPALMRKSFFDAAIAGKGCLRGRLDPLTGLPMFERIMPASVFVDENESISGRPPNVYLYVPLDRDEALVRWPNRKEEIDNAERLGSGDDQAEFFVGNDTKTDMIMVIEAWHLPVGEKPGRYTVVTSKGDTLEDMVWDMPRYPLCFYDWKPAQSGFWGVGICEEVLEKQRQVNGITTYLQRLQQLASGVHILSPRKAKLNPDSITNGILNIYEYDGGMAPRWEVFNATPNDLVNERMTIINEAREQLGLSQTATQGSVAKGSQSGIAIQTQSDLNDLRHKENAQRFEDFAKDIAELLCLLNDAALDVNKNVAFPQLKPGRGGNAFNSSTKWADVRIDPDDFRITCQPISSLPTTPSGRTEMIEKWLQIGAITPQDAMAQLDFPDTGEIIDRKMIDMDYAYDQIERILDGDEFIEPNKYQNLQVAADCARERRLRIEIEGAPDEAIQRLEAFADACQAEITKSQTPAIPDPAAAPMDPAAMAAGPAVAPLMPV